MAEIDCPNCSAPIEYDPGHAAAVVCAYCNSAVRVAAGAASIDAKLAPLAPMPTRFAIEKTGRICGIPFTVIGQARYEYEDGLWDEWNLVHDDGSHSWITEDEGDFIWFRDKKRVAGDWPSNPRPGRAIDLAGSRVSIREIGEAYVVGAQGQLTMIPEWGVDISYIDGVSDGRAVVVMRYGGGLLLCEGDAVAYGDIVFDS